MPAPHFRPAAIRFLKQLKANNDREWFAARKHLFEEEVQAPWLAVLDALNEQFAEWAPAYVRPARKAAMRIYRDIRFSSDKRPFKANLGAWFSPTVVERTSGGGFYGHIAATEVVVAAGVYMPMPEQLLAIRRHLQTHHAEMRRLLHETKRRKLLPELDANPLTRMPKGFPADDPAGDLLMCRQWALSTRLPVEVATTPRLVAEMVKRYRAALPVVQMLNEPLLRARPAKKSLF